MAEHPKVFISYSHDSAEHRRWVSELGAKLRHSGVDAILDQWDLGPGDDATRFMELGVRDSNRVLVICTDSYVSKANAGEGGVGYERMIVTAQLVQDLGTNKFIPIIRQASGEEKMPTFLGARVYIDFTDNSQFDGKFDELLHELHQVPVVEKPPLGKNPFAKLPSGQEAPPLEGLNIQPLEIPAQVGSAADAYSAAVEVARSGDMFGWRKYLKRIKPNTFNLLVKWGQNEMANPQPDSKEQLFQVLDTAVEIISPLISVALAGVESGREQFRDQKSALYDLLNIPGWSGPGDTVWAHIPDALGYVYHSLHGGLSISTNQLALALNLARTKIPDLYTTNPPHVWEKEDLMGWSGALGGNCREGWEYLSTAYNRWEWLAPIFGDELEYRTSLVAYYMALSIHELASTIDSGEQNTVKNVPLTFISEGQDINQRAVSLLIRNPEALTELWTCLTVTRELMENSWRDWIHSSAGWSLSVNKSSVDTRVYHQNLFELL